MSARFWTAAEILRGLDDEFAANKRPARDLDIARECMRDWIGRSEL